MNRRVKQLIKKFALFIVLCILSYLADYLPDALWSLGIQIGLDGATLIVGIRLLMAVNQNMNNHGNNED
mgnify:CR=1 FL=1